MDKKNTRTALTVKGVRNQAKVAKKAKAKKVTRRRAFRRDQLEHMTVAVGADLANLAARLKTLQEEGWTIDDVTPVGLAVVLQCHTYHED